MWSLHSPTESKLLRFKVSFPMPSPAPPFPSLPLSPFSAMSTQQKAGPALPLVTS